MKKECHPLAAIFPLMDGEEFGRLIKSIKEIGLLEPIVLDKFGKVIDGRNRLNACDRAGVDPRFTTYKGDDVATYIIAKNIMRRHLTSSQRAAFASKVMGWYRTKAKARKEEGQKKGGPEGGRGKKKNLSRKTTGKVSRSGEAVVRAAKDFKTNPKYVKAAETLAENAPDLLAQVEAGKKSITEAKKEYDEKNPQMKETKKTIMEEQNDGVNWEEEVGKVRKTGKTLLRRLEAIEDEFVSFVTELRDLRELGNGKTGKEQGELTELIVEMHKIIDRVRCSFEPASI